MPNKSKILALKRLHYKNKSNEAFPLKQTILVNHKTIGLSDLSCTIPQQKCKNILLTTIIPIHASECIGKVVQSETIEEWRDVWAPLRLGEYNTQTKFNVAQLVQNKAENKI